jgi:hypothetical protein
VRFRLGPVFVYLVNDPELIRSVLVTRADRYHKGRGLERAKRLLGEGLLTSEDAVHLRQRRLMQPAFHRLLGLREIRYPRDDRDDRGGHGDPSLDRVSRISPAPGPNAGRRASAASGGSTSRGARP